MTSATEWSAVVADIASTDAATPVTVPGDLRDFLCARLREELRTGRTRSADSASLVEQIFVDLDAGRPVERWAVRLLLHGYREHPDFRPAWQSHLA